MNEILAFKLGKEFYGLEIDNVIKSAARKPTGLPVE